MAARSDPTTETAKEAPSRFYDGRNAVAHAVRVAMAGTKLRIVAPDGRLLAEWPLNELEAVDMPGAGAGGAYALAGDLAKGGGARLILADGGTRNMLLALRPDLGQWRRQRRRRALRRAALWGGVVAGLLVAFYFTFPLIAEAAARAMPRRWEMPVGQSMREAMLSLSPTCHGEPGYDALMGLLTRLAPDEIEDPPLTLDIVDGGMVNAFALPGNHIVLFRGLIEKAGSGDEVAGVLAHELAHQDLRHPMQGAIQQIGLSAVLTLAFGGSDASNVGQVLVGLTYTRHMEAAADARGVELLEAAHLRADGLASFFRRLKPQESEGLLPDWLASHPGLAERIAATDRPAGGESAFDADQWAAVKAVCSRTPTGTTPGGAEESSEPGTGTAGPAASPSGSTPETAPASPGNAQQGKPRKSLP